MAVSCATRVVGGRSVPWAPSRDMQSDLCRLGLHHRAAARHGVMLQVTGKVDRAGSVVHVVCWRIETVDGEAAGIRKGSRDFH